MPIIYGAYVFYFYGIYSDYLEIWSLEHSYAMNQIATQKFPMIFLWRQQVGRSPPGKFFSLNAFSPRQNFTIDSFGPFESGLDIL